MDINTNMDRRTFLMGGLVALVFGMDEQTPNSSEIPVSEITSPWTFMNHIKPSYENVEDIRARCIEIGPLISHSPNDPLIHLQEQGSRNRLMRFVQDSGRTLVTDPQLIQVTAQLYGTPLDYLVGQAFTEYASGARNFLHETISELPLQDLTFTLGDSDYAGKAFITNGVHMVHEFTYLISTDGNEERITITRLKENRGHGSVRDNENNYFIALVAGEGSLNAPFSETLHLATRDVFRDYVTEVGSTVAYLADETFVEAAAAEIAQQYVKQQSIPGGEEHVLAAFENMVNAGPIYRHVPEARELIQDRGLHAVTNMYLQNPEEFMSLLSS